MKNLGNTLILPFIVVLSIFCGQAMGKMQIGPGAPENQFFRRSSDNAPDAGGYRIEPDRSAQRQSSDFDYILGKNLAMALSDVKSHQTCSIIYGQIQNLRFDEKDKFTKHVDFFVEEWLAGKGEVGRNELQLTFYMKASNKANWNEKPFENVILENGEKLVLSYCADSFIRFVVADQVSLQYYLRRIKAVIEYDASNIVDKSSEAILDIIRSEKSRVFTGYIIERFGQLGTRSPATLGEGDDRAIVLTELVGKKYVPKQDSWRHLGTLTKYLSEDNVLTASTRNAITKKLIEIASGYNLDEVEQALSLLVPLVQNDKINIEQYLTVENRPNLRQNYRLLGRKHLTEKGREKFERLVGGFIEEDKSK